MQAHNEAGLHVILTTYTSDITSYRTRGFALHATGILKKSVLASQKHLVSITKICCLGK